MSTYKAKINPFNGKLQRTLDETSIDSLSFKAGVANEEALPSSGNTVNDARIANDTHHLYIWSGSAWVDQGDILDVSKDAVGLGNCDNTSDANKPISTATQTALDLKYDELDALEETEKLILNFDDGDAQTSTTDDSGNYSSFTFGGNAQTSTTQKKFGTSSLHTNYVDGTGADYFQVNSFSEKLFANNTDSWTMDYYFYANNSGSTQYLLTLGTSTSNTRLFHRIRPSRPDMAINCLIDGNVISTASYNITLDTWNHYAVVVKGDGAKKDIGFYLNGTQVAFGTTSANADVNSELILGCLYKTTTYEDSFDGYIDGFRFQKENVFSANPDAGLTDTIVVPVSAPSFTSSTTDQLAEVESDGTLSRTGIVTSDVSDAVAHKDLTNNPHAVDASDVGLGNVDNTADLDKPVSTATQTALDEKYDELNALAPIDLLLHFDGADGATTTSDSAVNGTNSPNTVTLQDSTDLDDTIKKFGTTGLHFPDDGYMEITDSVDWDFCGNNTDTRTLSCWLYLPSANNFILLAQQGTADSTHNWRLSYDHGGSNDRGLQFQVYDGSQIINTPGNANTYISKDTWSHIAVVKVADKYGIYINGQQVSYVQDSSTGTFPGNLFVNKTSWGPWPGDECWIDEYLLARSNVYGANPNSGNTDSFSVPTSAHTDVVIQDELAEIESDGTLSRTGIVTSDVSSAVSLKHTQNTDTKLDEGGANELSAEDAVKSSIGIILNDGTDAELTTGLKANYLTIPFDCEIQEVILLADASGSIQVDIWKTTYANFDAGSTHPVDGDSITASATPTISTATKSLDSTLTGWTTTLSQGDILAYYIDSVTTIKKCSVILNVKKV
jgi:hypothetical protein